MQISSDKSLINVVNAAVNTNHQQIKSRLLDLISKVYLIPNREDPIVRDVVEDLILHIKDIELKLDDVTDWIKVMKVTTDD